MSVTLSTTSGNYLGPLSSLDTSRAQAQLYSANLAAAYIPLPLLNKPKGFCSRAVESLLIKPATTLDLLEVLKDDIENHIEYRIQDFFHRLLLVHNTGFEFDFYYKADIQVGNTKSTGSKTANNGRYAAAHSSTLPCLRITDPKEKERSIVFGGGSSFYHAWNATVCLPEAVNKVDSALDKTSKQINEEETLRFRAIEILNAVSNGTKTPDKGFKIFLNTILRYTEKLKEIQQEEGLYVLEIYEKIVKRYSKSIEKSNWIFENLCFNKDPDIKEIFKNTQKNMHDLFVREMNALRPTVCVFKPLPGQDPAKFKNEIQVFFLARYKKDKLASKTAEEYVRTCIKTDAVRCAVLNYLVEIKEEKTLAKELNLILKIKKKATIKKLNLPVGLQKIHQTVLDAISKQHNTLDPGNMGPIVLKLARDISLKPYQ